MLTGYGLSNYDLSSMAHYGDAAPDTAPKEDHVHQTHSAVVGLQTMFKAHRRTMQSAVTH